MVEEEKKKRDQPSDRYKKTALSEDQKAAIRYWFERVGAHIIEWDSINKTTHHIGWPTEDDTKLDYESSLQSGLYDKGIAVRCGKFNRVPHTGMYLGALDFDSLEAFEKFCEAWGMDREELANSTRVEWHQDPSRIHIIFISRRPFRNISPCKGLEVRGENRLLTVSPSIHKDGNCFVPIGTTVILVLDSFGQMRLEGILEALALEKGHSYLPKEEKKKYIEYLEREDTVLNEGERHSALLVLGTSYFYRHTGEWATMTDNQRLERLIAYHNRHCNPHKTHKEILELWEWIKKTHTGRRQEERDAREDEKKNGTTSNINSGKDLNPVIFAELNGNDWYKINEKPPKFIIADKRTKRLLEAVLRTTETVKKSGDGNGPELLTRKQSVSTKPYLACIPSKVIVHKSPIESIIKNGEKYTLHFIGAEKSGNKIIKCKTISEIVTELKQSGNALSDFGIEVAISAIIKGFERKQLLEENSDMEYAGLFIEDESGKLIVSNIMMKQDEIVS